MRIHIAFSFLLAAAVAASAACGQRSDQREYTLQGQVLSVTADRREATIKHEDIKGFMPAMTMPYKVKEVKELEGVAPGDLINAKLVVITNDAYLETVKKVGSAPLEKPVADGPAASSGFELLKEGEPVPNVKLVDENGDRFDFEAYKGKPVMITFMYTKCPMPAFCPMMDRNFAAVQTKLKEEHIDEKVRLLSVSFDPAVDKPPVLKQHAKDLGADPKIWAFATGDRDDIDQFAARFGLFVNRALNDQRDITHNLRTALVDAKGNLVKVYTGNEWTPAQAIADLKALG